MKHTITATFKTRIAAESALRQIENLGITEENISLVVTDETRGKTFNIDEHSKADEGAAAGATAGGLIGAVLGSLATATAMAIPGLNIVISGALVSALAGLGAGAATGGLVGALIGAGIPEHEAKIYEDELRAGAILIAVEAKDGDQRDQIKDIFEREDAYNLAA
jgi:uncharacterized membrane protein